MYLEIEQGLPGLYLGKDLGVGHANRVEEAESRKEGKANALRGALQGR